MLTRTIHVPDIINGNSISAFQYLVVLLCGLVLFIDGFDTQGISYMAPMMAKEWSLSREMLGPVFSSALAGLMVGYLILSPLSDRFGHRRILIASTAIFALLTLATVFTTNVVEVIALRCLTGMGLGTAIPSAVAMTSEYSPRRLRASFVLAIYCGFSLGFVAAGVAAASLLPAYGWRSLLWVGALVPLALSLVLFFLLPESLDRLVRLKADDRLIRAILRRIEPRLADTQSSVDFTTDRQETSSAVSRVFQSGRRVGTLLLWFVFTLNLAEFYALQSWLPTILTNLNYAISTVAVATSLTTTGGIVAAFIVGPAMDRLGLYGSVACLYFAGVVSVAFTGIALDRPEWTLLTATFFAGFCVSGGQKSVIALAAVFYPAPVRSTGVGWALGFGRIGGIAGPSLVSMLLGWNIAPASIFFAAAIPMLLAGAAVALMGWIYRTDAMRVRPGLLA